MKKLNKSNWVLQTQLLDKPEAPYIHAYLSTRKAHCRFNKRKQTMVTFKNPKTISYLTVACIFLDYNNTHYGGIELSLAKYLK